MKPAGILTNVFLVLGALTIAGAASLPFRRTSIFRVRILFLNFYLEFVSNHLGVENCIVYSY